MQTKTLSRFWNGSYDKMPGHWLLATMGKKVLRPGGLELSHWMIDHLAIGKNDDVIEFAPGLGRTAELALKNNPRSYTGVEKNEAAAAVTNKKISGPRRSIQIGSADSTGLPSACATAAYGEAFLTMQSPRGKEDILREIARVLRPGGRFGMHELALSVESPDNATKVQRDLSENIRVNARPLEVGEWRNLLESAGFEIRQMNLLPMALLEPGRLLQDEGLGGVARMAAKLMLHPAALRRVVQMRRGFRKHSNSLQAIGIIARKK